MTARLICVGNLTVDEAVAPDGTTAESVGGDALFAALAARLVGGEPRVLAPLGTDASQALHDAVLASGTDPATLPHRAERTVRNVVRYAADGSRTWDLVHGDAHFETMSVQPADVEGVTGEGWLLSGMGLHAQLELAAWLRPRTAAPILFDPQEDYIAGNEAALLRAVAACDVFLPSEIEAVRLARTDDLGAAIRTFLDAGPSVVVVKRAEAGCLVATREHPEAVAIPAETVEAVDSTGAGDAFCGAFSAEYLRSADPVLAARAGAAAARVAVSGHGVTALLDAVLRGDLLAVAR